MELALFILFVGIYLFVEVCSNNSIEKYKHHKRNFSAVFCTEHKTGTAMITGILNSYTMLTSERFLSISASWRYPLPSTDMMYQTTGINAFLNALQRIKQTPHRSVVIIRHPLDIICSAYRYHKFSGEGHAVNFGEKVYGTYLRSLNTSAGLLVEMSNGSLSFSTLNKLAHFHRDVAMKTSVKVMKLESFKYSYNKSLVEVADYLELNSTAFLVAGQHHSIEEFRKSSHSSVHDSVEHTVDYGALYGSLYPYEFINMFECVHYREFEDIYGLDVISLFGYQDSLVLYNVHRKLQCTQ